MDIGRSISQIHRRDQIFWAECLKNADISNAEYPLLLLLYQEDGVPQEQLASELGLHKSAVAKNLKSLEKKGFIRRSQDPQDLRCNLIELTDRGREYRPILQRGQELWQEVVLDGIGWEQLQILQMQLDRMLQNLDNYLKKEKAHE